MSAFKQLGPILLPQAEASVDSQPRKAVNLSETGFLSGGDVDVERVTNNAPTLTLSGRFRPPLVPRDRVQLLVDEFDSLLASDIGPLGLFDQQDTNGRLAGYYQIESGSAEPVQPARPTIQEWSLTLRRVGNPSTLRRAIATATTDIDNPFVSLGSRTPELYLPDSATGTAEWIDVSTGETAQATQASTVATANGTVGAYIPDNAPFDDPTLLYSVPLADDVDACRVFNDRATSKFGGGGIRQWRAVYDPEFQTLGPDEALVLSNARLQISLETPPNPRVTVGEWDPATGGFSTLIQQSIWYPTDIDLVDIGLHRLVADLRMTDGSVTHPIRVRLPYGVTRARITSAPRATGTFPSGLESQLDPIAYEGETVLQPTRGVVPTRRLR